MREINVKEMLQELFFMEERNAAREYLIDHFADATYDSVESFLHDLEMGSCNSGSFGGDMIYTGRILDKLKDEDWQTAIQDSIDDYTDATGEIPSFDLYGSGFQLEHLVTFAVDWQAGEIANRIRGHGVFYIVTGKVDHLDPSPKGKVFLNESDAVDYLHDLIDHELQHNQGASKAELRAIEENMFELNTIEQEHV